MAPELIFQWDACSCDGKGIVQRVFKDPLSFLVLRYPARFCGFLVGVVLHSMNQRAMGFVVSVPFSLLLMHLFTVLGHVKVTLGLVGGQNGRSNASQRSATLRLEGDFMGTVKARVRQRPPQREWQADTEVRMSVYPYSSVGLFHVILEARAKH